MKTILGIGTLLVIGIIGFVFWTPGAMETNAPATSIQQEVSTETRSTDKTTVSEGVYVVQTEGSSVNWAGKKPFIEGYVNSGSIGITGGTIEVSADSTTAEFTIDMSTLSVSGTPTKPGAENALEGHLKGERWFDVETFPEASFSITNAAPRADAESTFSYDVTGELTMKGVTDTLSFPATIYTDNNGTLIAEASFEFDRTVWGITAGSGSFFDNLEDNVVDDMVALSFRLTAESQ